MKKLSFLFALLICAKFYAQSFDSIAWKYSETILPSTIEKHLEIIASDEFEGRETGKLGQKLAMKYLIDQFNSFGINDHFKSGYVQSFNLIEQQNDQIKITVGDDLFILNSDFLFSPSIFNKFQEELEFVYVDYGIADKNYNSYEGIDVKGKVVIFWNELPRTELGAEWTTKKRIKQAKKMGALGVCYFDPKVSSMLKKYKNYFKRPRMKLADEPIKEFFTVQMDRKMMAKILAQGKLKLSKIEKKGTKRKDQFTGKFFLDADKPTELLTGENVLAYIPGKDLSKEVVIITAHYDHLGTSDSLIFNGADDDGSGTSAVVAIAEAFMNAVKEGNGPRRSILIMPVSGEEKGLLGSKYYANNPLLPLSSTIANLNVDMIGRYDKDHKEGEDYVYLIGSNRLSQELHQLSEGVNDLYSNLNLDYKFNEEDDPNRFYYRSDHYNFAKNNIPVIFYFSGVHKDYHKSTDTYEKIDFVKSAKIARLVFLTAWHLANTDERVQLNEGIEPPTD